MHIKVGTPEVLIFSSAILGYGGHMIPLWTFLGLGVLGAIFRATLEFQAKTEQKKHVDENMDSLKAAATELGTIFGLKPGNGNGQTTH